MLPLLPLPLLFCPAQVQAAPPAPAAVDRELAFPGHGGFPLKGSVRPGGTHPYFAVLVAGSGPTDRDWSNPLIRDPRNGTRMESHGGRDFAAWLAARGIGSLRYDKRFLGSRDPKLDISLDAQVGDIRAALRAARALPEAKGKRILLVGHSEGSVLSLVAAQDADALLLLAMPAQPMGRLIQSQVQAQLAAVRAQLPEGSEAANLAHLEATLKAIRERKPAPTPGPQVFPGVRALCTGLAAPESQEFLRDTLDLDPWVLAARVLVPCAVAWGDRDVQARRPAQVPASFPGRVIDLPGANHVLKQETRPLEQLNGGTALSAYGDATPMADLKPLAAWLEGLAQPAR